MWLPTHIHTLSWQENTIIFSPPTPSKHNSPQKKRTKTTLAHSLDSLCRKQRDMLNFPKNKLIPQSQLNCITAHMHVSIYSVTKKVTKLAEENNTFWGNSIAKIKYYRMWCVHCRLLCETMKCNMIIAGGGGGGSDNQLDRTTWRMLWRVT